MGEGAPTAEAAGQAITQLRRRWQRHRAHTSPGYLPGTARAP